MSTQKGICHHFQRGSCKFGARCKWSHDLANPSNPTSAPATTSNVSRKPEPGSDLYRSWRRLLGPDDVVTKLSPVKTVAFFQDALKILDTGEAGIKQDLVKDLGGEKGLRRIVQLVETDFTAQYSGVQFDPHTTHFLKVITHEELQSSLILEKSVGTIYNVIYGPNGKRGIEFFQKIAELLSTSTGCMVNQVREDALFAATAALLNTLSLNQGATVQEEFKNITNKLSNCCEEIPMSNATRSARTNIARIRERLDMGDAISHLHYHNQNKTRAPFRPFEIEVDLPGSLSRDGPRHDNDHDLIDRISILPTTEEIMSNRPEFLPAKGTISTHHLTGLRRLLDSQFRLLREDTTGQLRDAIRAVVENWEKLVHGTKGGHRVQTGTQTRIYEDANFEGLQYNKKRGFSIDLSFTQPKKLSQMTAKERGQWWEDSKDLREGSLLALVDDLQQTSFVLVSHRAVKKRKTNQEHEYDVGTPSTADTGVHDLASNASRAMISVCLVDPLSHIDQRRLITLAKGTASRKQVLVEFPGMLFVAFEPVLKCLQLLFKQPDLPFSEWLTPRPETDDGIVRGGGFVDIPPPRYLTGRTRQQLNLKSITKDGGNLFWSAERTLTADELQNRTTLDHGQCVALSSALRHELALIQGPPGTGKSYVGLQLAKVLLSNRDSTDIGPIICVCYTNHALDQFLEQLLDSKFEKVVRLGSRSKNPRLQDLTIQNLKSDILRTGNEKYLSYVYITELKESEAEINDICRRLGNLGHWKELKRHLEENYAAQHSALFSFEDEEGFQIQGRPSNLHAKAVDDWVNGRGNFRSVPASTGVYRPTAQLLLANVWKLSQVERARLKTYWENEMEEDLRQELQGALKQQRSAMHNLNMVYREADRRCLAEAHVIGATTTGFAMNSELLRSLQVKVLIVEEAAEVLQAHILTALPPSIEHAILIGDHQQLRPQITNYHLGMESAEGQRYALDESLFERLANERFEGGRRFPIAKLDTQRRMHPSISALIRKTLYPELQDHDETINHAEVSGMRRRLFWLDHDKLEDSAQDNDPTQTSKTNEWEANMVVALVRHLSRQAVYGKGEIAVITPYLGQLRKLRQKLKASFDLVLGDRDQEELDKEDESDADQEIIAPLPVKEVQKGSLLDGLRIATVDNFQGEEAKVIIVSLVRSNPKRNCGFLKTSNRINVLLSRAQNGMYIIGNTDTSIKVKMWADVIGILKNGGNLGRQLELHCPRHPKNEISVSEPDHFALRAPEGGCGEGCGLRLSCGHTCLMKCHSEPLHNSVVCLEDCTRQHDCGHSCPKRCGEICGKCEERITSVNLPCGHTAKNVKCWEMRDLAKIRCQQTVDKVLPCGHAHRLACCTDTEAYRCRTPCAVALPCGHDCQRACWQCKTKDENEQYKVDHGTCITKCGRNYSTCNHSCTGFCHNVNDEPCLPCSQPCEVRCVHSKCPKPCLEPCQPCAEQCSWSCIHQGSCAMPCAVPCDIVPCSKRCDRELSCGHHCPGVCGEVCPTQQFCQICGSPEVLNRTVDFITFESYSDINVDEDPMIFLSCGHFYTISSLDGTLHMNEMYEINAHGTITAPKVMPRISTGEPRKGCPECRAPLRDVHRYNRLIKRALLDESTRKFVAHANATYLELVREVGERETSLENERAAFVAQNRPESLKDYQTPGKRLLQKIGVFQRSVSRAEQPFGKVNALVVDARRRRNAAGPFEFDESLIQTGAGIRCQSLYLRCNWALFWDLHTISVTTAVDQTLRDRITREQSSSWSGLKKKCAKLLEDSLEAKLPQQQIEARIYHAQFVALELKTGDKIDLATKSAMRATEKESLEMSLQLCGNNDSCKHMKGDVEQAQRILGGATFYDVVTTEEKQAVYEAMAQSFRGSGHWYYCENNHPFTVGECGMPMERARCPECGAAVGGQNHTPAQGVRRADDVEAEFGRLRM